MARRVTPIEYARGSQGSQRIGGVNSYERQPGSRDAHERKVQFGRRIAVTLGADHGPIATDIFKQDAQAKGSLRGNCCRSNASCANGLPSLRRDGCRYHRERPPVLARWVFPG